MRIFLIVSILAFSLAAAGCMDKPTLQLTGTLRSVPSVDGGPPHNWVLVMGEEGTGYAMPLDVAAIKFPLAPLDGKRVTITANNNLGGSQQTWIVKAIQPAMTY